MNKIFFSRPSSPEKFKRKNNFRSRLSDVTNFDEIYKNNDEYENSSSSSSSGGRSKRSPEDTISNLRKENFNLKLRIYLMEESMPEIYQKSQVPGGHSNLLRQILDDKIQIELMRRDIADKQELLKDAATFIIQMETIQENIENEAHNIIHKLKDRVQYLELERDMLLVSDESSDCSESFKISECQDSDVSNKINVSNESFQSSDLPSKFQPFQTICLLLFQIIIRIL